MLRGEIWYAAWPGDLRAKQRPVLIVSNDFRNSAPHLLDVVAVKLTGLYRDDRSKKPTHPSEDVVVTLKKETIIRCAAIFAIEKSILKNRVWQLSSDVMREVDEKLRQVLQLSV